MIKKPLVILVVCVLCFCCMFAVEGAGIKTKWRANTESDLAGYKIYSGTSSGNYDNVNDVGNQINYTVTGLTDGVTYYLALTAYDTSGNESGYSTEVFGEARDVTPPANPQVFEIVAKVTIIIDVQ